MPTPNTPVIVMSENGRFGALAAMQILRKGGAALDAVEAACRYVEDDVADRTVGRGGTPNVLGQVELDASIMDGRTLRAGAVAALRGYGHPITLARQVMTELPHVLLVGEGAARFAAEMGHTPEDQLTPETYARWRARFAEVGIELDEANLRGTFDRLRTMTSQLTRPMNLTEQIDKSKLVTGTVNFLARDRHGDLASAVSTSGLGWKYPGRVGDSPLIGAGNYCDNRYGAAACTGMGELAIRVSTARSLVLYMKMGMTLREAGLETLQDLQALGKREEQYMNIVALTPAGDVAGFSDVPGRLYAHMTGDMDEPVLVERITLE